MNLNPKEIGEILIKNLDELTTEEFIANVKEFCPYLFEEDNDQSQIPELRFTPPDNPLFPIIEKIQPLQQSANLKK